MNAGEREMHSVEEIATQWAVRASDGLSADECSEFERWLHASPEHLAAFAEADLASVY